MDVAERHSHAQPPGATACRATRSAASFQRPPHSQGLTQYKIREDVWAFYQRGKYDTAVFQAMKAIEVRVREVAGFTNADHGKDMIARAFNAKAGPLRDETAGPAEREAMAALVTGAYGLYRNSYAHRNVDHNDADEVAEIIMLANHLLRIVDARAATIGAQP